jgi:hypothetical protein
MKDLESMAPEDGDCLSCCCAVYSVGSSPTFHRCLVWSSVRALSPGMCGIKEQRALMPLYPCLIVNGCRRSSVLNFK